MGEGTSWKLKENLSDFLRVLIESKYVGLSGNGMNRKEIENCNKVFLPYGWFIISDHPSGDWKPCHIGLKYVFN